LAIKIPNKTLLNSKTWLLERQDDFHEEYEQVDNFFIAAVEILNTGIICNQVSGDQFMPHVLRIENWKSS
jgi:hypothetical protein